MATEAELRALLAEARKFWRICDCGNDECKCVSDLCVRIDAALAEPVVDYKRERDEARAEVERLREVVNAWAKTAEWNYQRGAEAMREAVDSAKGVVECERDTALHKVERERDEARAEVERLRALIEDPDKEIATFTRKQYDRAYQRGAEAMREAAAKAAVMSQLSTPLEISVAINALRMPKDKP